ncbi:class I SAM-dependent methyltransferase [Oscillatoria sp. CS-180]|uniref:class I SAM-dependent methyltransferase n=1 Tax=Oscillatoria sp. CS-180 TaxID=3021720 RepID=UPI00232EAF52|nr:class I SAM-dependent methyltransferase [Oscillatoria sp. CS-180]MDB9526161.1 class I SAM-dependent methyltransferase [Oscillatoria sp. CS-180]
MQSEQTLIQSQALSGADNAVLYTPEQLQVRQALDLSWGMGERLMPDQIGTDSAGQKVRDQHFQRYKTACRFVKNKKVLDIACGEGYGSHMLHLAGAASVKGVDVFEDAVRHARSKYQTDGLEFVHANAETFTCPERFDVVISFETIEHLLSPEKFLTRLSNLLTPQGDLLLSVPLGETRHFDPYHLHAFSQQNVFDLLDKTGFSVELHRVDECFLSRRELLESGQLHPETSPSARNLFFTWRGWRTVTDFLFKGGFDIPQLVVLANKRPG